MTDQGELPDRSDHTAHVREDLAKALEENYDKWGQDVSADKFCEKSGLLSPNARSGAQVNFIAALAKSIDGPESCQKLLDAIGRQLQDASDEPDKPMPRPTQGKRGPQGEWPLHFAPRERAISETHQWERAVVRTLWCMRRNGSSFPLTKFRSSRNILERMN